MSTWKAPTRAREMEDQAAAWLADMFPETTPRNAFGRFTDPEPADSEGAGPREVCPGCGRRVFVAELVDARLIPEHPGDYACGACRGSLDRSGVVTRGEWVERYGAPAATVAKLRAVEGPNV